jgi:DNA repair protein RadC
VSIYAKESQIDPRLLPQRERPREKILREGPDGLTDAELLTIIIGSGTAKNGVAAIAAKLLTLLDRDGGFVSAEAIGKVKGVGQAKSALLLAAMELTRRNLCPGPRKITKPADIAPLIAHYNDRIQEHFFSISLNGAHEVIAVRVVSVGLVNRTIVHPREVFADPLTDRAAALIVAHNHPSGNVEPSEDDIEITRRLRSAGDVLGIKILDHIIFSREGYHSFLEHGEIE